MLEVALVLVSGDEVAQDCVKSPHRSPFDAPSEGEQGALGWLESCPQVGGHPLPLFARKVRRVDGEQHSGVGDELVKKVELFDEIPR